MANAVLLKESAVDVAQLVFADHATDFVGGATKTSLVRATTTKVQMDLTSLANAAGRESAKVDLGAARAERYSVNAVFEFAVAPTTAKVVELYWAPSPISTAANGNPMSIDGVDAAAPSGFSTLAELVAACQWIGVFICTADATTQPQNAYVGTFSPAERHGILIVKNESGQAFVADAVEMHVVFDPIVTEVQ